MDVRWLGWAGVELEAQGARLVIDLLGDAFGVVRALGDAAASIPLPKVVPAHAGESVAGLVTHLHRDHTDAAALAVALMPGAPVLQPPDGGGDAHENLWLAQAEAELSDHGLSRQVVRAWETRSVGPFQVTALPSVDGIGDPQVSWLVEADGKRVLHLGDTMFHGYWWRMSHRHGPFDLVLTPINGAVVCFPHCEPPSTLSADLDPAQAALVGHLLGAQVVIPIHFGGFENQRYREVPHSFDRFSEAAGLYSYRHEVLQPGQVYPL